MGGKDWEMTPYEFRQTGCLLFATYLGKEYVVDFIDYIDALLFYGDVETTELCNMLEKLYRKIQDALSTDWDSSNVKFDMVEFNKMMACEEMMKIIRENSSIMDNDDE